jgi:hypothetical protein
MQNVLAQTTSGTFITINTTTIVGAGPDYTIPKIHLTFCQLLIQMQRVIPILGRFRYRAYNLKLATATSGPNFKFNQPQLLPINICETEKLLQEN